MTGSRIFVAALILTLPSLLAAGTLTIDFEAFSDGQAITNQIPGLTFSNTLLATTGISLNGTDFPPHSGVNAVIDDGGPVAIGFGFGQRVLSFSGYFTYLEPVTIIAYDDMDVFLGSVTSSADSNLGGSEFLQIMQTGIARVDIVGNPEGTSFVMDDISLDIVPEPGSVFLALAGIALLVAGCRKSCFQS